MKFYFLFALLVLLCFDVTSARRKTEDDTDDGTRDRKTKTSGDIFVDKCQFAVTCRECILYGSRGNGNQCVWLHGKNTTIASKCENSLLVPTDPMKALYDVWEFKCKRTGSKHRKDDDDDDESPASSLHTTTKLIYAIVACVVIMMAF